MLFLAIKKFNIKTNHQRNCAQSFNGLRFDIRELMGSLGSEYPMAIPQKRISFSGVFKKLDTLTEAKMGIRLKRCNHQYLD